MILILGFLRLYFEKYCPEFQRVYLNSLFNSLVSLREVVKYIQLTYSKPNHRDALRPVLNHMPELECHNQVEMMLDGFSLIFSPGLRVAVGLCID